MTILVTGAGGAIGGHLVQRLLDHGFDVKAVDWKPLGDWYQFHDRASNFQADLSRREECLNACSGVSGVYNLAADMGGIGFIEAHPAECMMSVLITTHMLQAAQQEGVLRFFQASSACVYNATKQNDPNVTALKEEDAWPAMPEFGYGTEKLYGEELCKAFYGQYGLETRVARYHNVYGPHSTFEGGREKAPAALCRKIAMLKRYGGNEIEVWGDGTATRSFMFVDDCVDGTVRIMGSDFHHPLNLGSSELISVNDLAYLVADIAGVGNLQLRHNLNAAQGVRGRNSDNTLIRNVLGWEPRISLRVGLEKLFAWVYDQTSG